MKLELYTVKLSPFSKKVELMLSMKGIEFERITPEREWVREGGYGEINPIRKLPTLMVDGVAMPESEVICEFIEDNWPEPPLLPTPAADRAKVRLLSRIADLYIMSPIIEIMNNASSQNSEDIDNYLHGKVEKGLGWLEHFIAPGPYATGDVRSMADCTIAPILYFVSQAFPHFGMGELPGMGSRSTSYLEAVKSDNDVSRTLARMQEGVEERFGTTA